MFLLHVHDRYDRECDLLLLPHQLVLPLFLLRLFLYNPISQGLLEKEYEGEAKEEVYEEWDADGFFEA